MALKDYTIYVTAVYEQSTFINPDGNIKTCGRLQNISFDNVVEKDDCFIYRNGPKIRLIWREEHLAEIMAHTVKESVI